MPEGQERSGSGGKPFDIDKRWFAGAWEQVRANKGGPGVDGVTLEAFGERLDDNLYKLWNRMSSGTYFPSPVKAVPIPKSGGGTRWLGVPTVADRVAQAVVARLAGAQAEQVFVEDSYGFRPGRGALDAVRAARRRCLEFDWVVDLDIAKFFDSVDHGRLLQIVEWLRWPRWAVICVERWITAPVAMPDGTSVPRDKGTPQGGVISPVLANLYLHVAFDVWMGREFPDVPFERYADDAICHCRTRMRAERLVGALRERFAEVGLELHPEKTKIVYCKDSNRRGGGLPYPTRFVFLGFEFRARTVKGPNGLYDCFLPAADPAKLAGLRQAIRAWRIPRRTAATWGDLASWLNPWARGWLGYYAAFSPWAVLPVLKYLNAKLLAWMRSKYRLRSVRRALARWDRVTRVGRGLFFHWRHTTFAHS